jgi:acyl transferase domain-containing protein
MASIIKCVVALENKTVLPNIKFETPNPKSENFFFMTFG